ncbi:MAG: SRPBCC domain-containing protein [Woeseiaceae bacterium]
MTDDDKYAERAFYKVFVNAPIETVWSELIDTSSARPFFWNSCWDTNAMAPGNSYRVVSADGKVVAVVGDILEIEAPYRLVTSFRLTSLDDPASIVTYLLKEKNGGTEFTLVTERIPAGSKSEKSMADGSQFITRNFKAYIETGKVTLGARLMLAMFRLMAPFTPKSMRADKWPLGRKE